MIKVKDLSRTFRDGTTALNRVSLEVSPGEFIVILGPSGSGKTTFLRSLNALEDLSAGTVVINGISLRADTKRQIRTIVGMIFQHFNLVGNLSALNNVLTGLLDQTSIIRSSFYLFSREQKLRALDGLDQVGLLNKAYSRVDRLSGGEQQRVGIARAVVRQPKVILADEPVASLDPVIAFNALSLLHDICKAKGITVLCSLHQVDLALRFADRIVGFSKGRVLFNESIDNIDQEYLQQVYGKNTRGMFLSSNSQPSSLPESVPATT